MRRLVASGFALVVLVVVAGCVAPADEPATTDLLFSGPEVAEARYECLLDKGWDVTLTDDGVVVASVPPAQVLAYRADSEACLREAGIDPDAPPSDEVIEAAYEWYSKVARCLTDAGWEVPEAPTFAAFRDSFDTDPWIPWDLISDEDYEAALEACPVMEEH